MEYLIENDTLAQAIAAAPVTVRHRALLAAVRSVESFEGAELTAQRDGSTLGRRRIVDQDLQVIADDHAVWLEQQVRQDAGDVRATWQRLRSAGLRLTTTHIERLYLAVDRGRAQENFVQLEVWLAREVVDQHLTSTNVTPTELGELVDLTGLPLDQELPLGAPAYTLRRAVAVAAFVALAAAAEGKRLRGYRAAMEGLTARNLDTNEEVPLDLPPGSEAELTWKGLRLFQDWTLSSAGRSGARICRHWALQLAEWTSPEGERHFSLVPMWVTSKPPAKLESRRLGDYELYGRLLKIDERMGVPMAYYFFALHGNRVSSEALRRVLQAAESGLIVMPEHDYQVLRRWGEAEYGF